MTRQVEPVIVKLITTPLHGLGGVLVARPGDLYDADEPLPDGCWRYALADANARGALLHTDQFGRCDHTSDPAA